VPPGDECLSALYCAVIATDHSSYDLEEVLGRANLVFGALGATRGLAGEKTARLAE